MPFSANGLKRALLPVWGFDRNAAHTSTKGLCPFSSLFRVAVSDNVVQLEISRRMAFFGVLKGAGSRGLSREIRG